MNYNQIVPKVLTIITTIKTITIEINNTMFNTMNSSIINAGTKKIAGEIFANLNIPICQDFLVHMIPISNKGMAKHGTN